MLCWSVVAQFHSQDEVDTSWQGETEKRYKCLLLRCLLWSQILSRTTSMSGDHHTECNTPSPRAWWGNPGDGYTVSITDTDTGELDTRYIYTIINIPVLPTVVLLDCGLNGSTGSKRCEFSSYSELKFVSI